MPTAARPDRLNMAWKVLSEALMGLVWGIVGEALTRLLWIAFGLIRDFFRFMHEFMENFFALLRPEDLPNSMGPDSILLRNEAPSKIGGPSSTSIDQVDKQKHESGEACNSQLRSLPHDCNHGFLKRNKWYAVARGFNPGIYDCWEAAQLQVNKFSGNKHMWHKFYSDAEFWVDKEIDSSVGRASRS